MYDTENGLFEGPYEVVGLFETPRGVYRVSQDDPDVQRETIRERVRGGTSIPRPIASYVERIIASEPTPMSAIRQGFVNITSVQEAALASILQTDHVLIRDTDFELAPVEEEYDEDEDVDDEE